MTPGSIGLGVAVAAVWGFNFVVADQAVADIPPFLLVALRYAVVALIFLPFTRRHGLPWRYIVVVGLLYGVVQFSGLFLGLRLGVGAGVAATLIQAQAPFTILLASVLLKERFGPLQWVGLAVAIGGLGLISLSGGGDAPVLGVLCVLAGALGWAGSNIFLKTAKGISAWSLTVWQSLAVIPPMLLASLAFEHDQAHVLRTIQPDTILAIGYITLLATGFGNYAWYRLIQQLGAANAAPFSLMVPVVGVLSGWLVLSERLSAAQVVGVALSLVGLGVIVFAPWLARRIFAPRIVTPLEDLPDSSP